MITKGEFKALVMVRRGQALKRLPRQLPPTHIDRKYRKRLRPVLADMKRLVEELLIPRLGELADGASRVATTDAIGDAPTASEIVDEIRERFAEEWSAQEFARIVRPVAGDIETWNAAQLNKTLRSAIGVDVVGDEPWLQRAAEEFTAENVALIKSIPSQFFTDLETRLNREIADGARPEELAEMIGERYDVSENRAKLIARDQTNKFNGDLNRVRQSDLGISAFVWRTVNDNRVREEHELREGQSYTWADPPDGETPGEPIQCRCYAEPDLAALINDV